MYCKYCRERLTEDEEMGLDDHYCRKKGLLNVDRDNSFLVSALIGLATDSAIIGGLLGGDIIGGVVGDLLDGDLFD